MERKLSRRISRRLFLLGSAFTSGTVAANLLSKPGLVMANAPAIITSEKLRPTRLYGVASGDITSNRAVVWSRCDLAARMIVEYTTSESFRNVRRSCWADGFSGQRLHSTG